MGLMCLLGWCLFVLVLVLCVQSVPPVNIVVDCQYIFPTKATASTGYPRSFIIERSLAWSSDPNAFLKFMFSM